MQEEKWLPVVGYEGLYEVSEFGRIRSLFRYKKILKWNIHHRTGYASVQLFRNKVGTRILVHRLVAMAFIDNPFAFPQVNHKDENKLNNAAENLEWTSVEENMRYGTRTSRQRASTDYSVEERKMVARRNGQVVAKAILQIKEGAVVAEYDSAKSASRKTGISHSHICECATGKSRKTAGGYEWKYKNRKEC